MKKTLVVALSVLALGLAGCADTTAQAEPAPTVTVTAEPVIKEVEVIKEVTPQSCIDALDMAGEAMMILSEVQGLVSPALEAAVNHDAPAMEALTSQIIMHNEEIQALTPDLGIVVNECRSSQ